MARVSSQSQAPSSRAARNPKRQTPAAKALASRVTLELGAWSFFGHWSLEPGAWNLQAQGNWNRRCVFVCAHASTARLNQDQIGFMLAQSQVVAAHFDFHRVPQRREAEQFNRGADQQAHFEQTTAVFGGPIDSRGGCGSANGQGGQRLRGAGHTQATFSSASGSTQMASASSALMPRRALQT